MVDTCTCTCLNERSSKKQGCESLRIHSFPKKLLVAVSVVVIIAMCLRPVDAAAIEKRHRLHESMSRATKDTGARADVLKDHRRRHQSQLRSGTQTTKEHGKTSDHYEKARIKIENKMALNKDNFEQRRKMLTEPGDYGSGMPVWLPKTNFVDIHFHKYGISHKSEAVKSKKIFEFLMRKLYKSLLEYHELFKRFKTVEVVSPDTQITSYNVKRQDIFNKTNDDIYSTIEDIKDAMISVKITKFPKINASKMKLNTIELKVDAAKYLKNDDILLRAYGNLLDNWYMEFNCSKVLQRKTKSRKVSQHRCLAYENNLRRKRDGRRRNKRKKLQGSS